MLLVNKRIIINSTHKNLFRFYSFYNVCERDAKSAHTEHTLISDSFRVVKFCSWRGEGRRGWKGRVKKEVRMKHIMYNIRIDWI